MRAHEYDAEVMRAAATARNGFEFDRMLEELEPLREQALPDEEQAYIANPLQAEVDELRKQRNWLALGFCILFIMQLAVMLETVAAWWGQGL